MSSENNQTKEVQDQYDNINKKIDEVKAAIKQRKKKSKKDKIIKAQNSA